MAFFLLAFPALFSIVNPIGGAFVFMSATRAVDYTMRSHLARWVAIHSFVILNVSIYVGAYVLEFFGISLPVLRVAGGVIITLTGWRLLNEGDQEEKSSDAVGQVSPEHASRIAFYPLTMPITAGPGAISVAVALGTSRPSLPAEWMFFLLGTTIVTALISAIVYVLYRNASRVSRAIGPTATTIVMRLSAFVLFCIGIQVLWTGVAELLRTLQSQ
jgi:multiple antibiotic resistance protein